VSRGRWDWNAQHWQCCEPLEQTSIPAAPSTGDAERAERAWVECSTVSRGGDGAGSAADIGERQSTTGDCNAMHVQKAINGAEGTEATQILTTSMLLAGGHVSDCVR